MSTYTALAVHSWTLYAMSISIISSRIIFRRITLGSFKKLQADDWLMLFILVPYTASVVLVNQVGFVQTIMERKFRYVLEEMQIITIWLVKACLLVLYWRIFPIETSTLKRRSIKGISLFCAFSFLAVQASLMLWCHPTEQYWNLASTNPQCSSYRNHNIVSLSLSLPNTILIMLVPVPFIPTPRRILLAILLLLGALVLTTSIASCATILSTPSSPTYLQWMTSEASLSIIFANLPFLTSLVVTAAPARLRHFSSHLTLSPWPRSRRGSWEYSDAGSTLAPHSPRDRLGSTATAISDFPSMQDTRKRSDTLVDGQQMGPEISEGSDNQEKGDEEAEIAQSPPPPEPVTRPPPSRDGEVPKMRLSGGLAEMGQSSVHDTQGWPIYWK